MFIILVFKFLLIFLGTIDKNDFDFVLLWYQKILPRNPSICFRYMKIKDLLFRIYSIEGRLDYLTMLLALCKDDCSILGLIKAISLIMNQENEIFNINNNFDNDSENHFIKFSMETLYKTLIMCFKNYMVMYNFCIFYKNIIILLVRINYIINRPVIKVTWKICYLQY